MGAETARNEEQQITELTQRIQGLEAELSEARAQLIGTHSRLLYARQSFNTNADTQAVILSSAAGGLSRQAVLQQQQAPIHIEPLPIHHILRRRWTLGNSIGGEIHSPGNQRICFAGAHAPNGQLRLFGLLNNGEAWEQHVPFSKLVNQGGIVIGRDPQEADLLLPENGVSRTHARIELGGNGLVISDLNSTNGIRVNGEHINSYNPQSTLADGSIIGLGNTLLRVEIVYASCEQPHK